MLDQLTEQLSEHVEYVFRSARGDGAAWPEAAQHYGVASVGGDGPAPVDEVRAVFEELVRRAGAHLEQLLASGQVEGGPRVEGIGRRLGDLPARETARYEQARVDALAPKKADVGVASIFANAAKTAANNPWASLTFDRQLTQHCASCGAPQRQEREFQCEYCGGDVFRRGSDFE